MAYKMVPPSHFVADYQHQSMSQIYTLGPQHTHSTENLSDNNRAPTTADDGGKNNTLDWKRLYPPPPRWTSRPFKVDLKTDDNDDGIEDFDCSREAFLDRSEFSQWNQSTSQFSSLDTYSYDSETTGNTRQPSASRTGEIDVELIRSDTIRQKKNNEFITLLCLYHAEERAGFDRYLTQLNESWEKQGRSKMERLKAESDLINERKKRQEDWKGQTRFGFAGISWDIESLTENQFVRISWLIEKNLNKLKERAKSGAQKNRWISAIDFEGLAEFENRQELPEEQE